MIKISSHNIISPLGWTTEDNYEAIVNGRSGICLHNNPVLSNVPFQASIIAPEDMSKGLKEVVIGQEVSKLEQLCICSVNKIIGDVDVTDSKTGFVFSTTKGNVENLSSKGVNCDTYLAVTAKKIAGYFGFVGEPYVVSNACISGLAAFVLSKRLIDAGIYDTIVIVGADVISEFIVSGFQSFHSLSSEPCKPYDKNRDGLTLGEAVGSVVVRKIDKAEKGDIILENGAISNDANHISGPSRTGEGLFRAINKTITEGDLVEVVSAHGTATPYNDDMESHAISRAGLSNVPVSGLKGYLGHTLGAAGVIESLISVLAMQNNCLIGTKGLNDQGVVCEINVAKETKSMNYSSLLKLMSGFGGCNAAVYLKKQL